MLIMFENSKDPATKYEGLVRAAFNNCNKYGDPWKCANQEFFNNFMPPNLNGKRALSRALCKLIFDNKDTENIGELIKLEDTVWVSKTQSDIITIIDRAIDWVKNI